MSWDEVEFADGPCVHACLDMRAASRLMKVWHGECSDALANWEEAHILKAIRFYRAQPQLDGDNQEVGRPAPITYSFSRRFACTGAFAIGLIAI